MIFAFTGPEKPTLGMSNARAMVTAAIKYEFAAVYPLEIRSGAAYGIDTAAYFASVAVREQAQHRVFVPTGCRYNQDLVIFAKQEGHEIIGVPGGYLKRDDALVEGADVLLAFPNSMNEVLRSGTWATIRRAWKRNIEVRYWPLDDKPGPVVRCT